MGETKTLITPNRLREQARPNVLKSETTPTVLRQEFIKRQRLANVDEIIESWSMLPPILGILYLFSGGPNTGLVLGIFTTASLVYYAAMHLKNRHQAMANEIKSRLPLG